jgi:PAS domain-containing protein
MIGVSRTTAIGYAVFDSSLRVLSCNDAYSKLVRIPREDLVGKRFDELFSDADAPKEMLERVLREGVVTSVHGFPYTFRHWTVWEERHYDFSAHLLGEPGDAGARVLVRISEAVDVTEPDIPSILHKLHTARTQPLFSGEDARGRLVDVYVHPAASACPDKLALIAVYRDSHQNITIEIPSSALHRIALAAAAVVKS